MSNLSWVWFPKNRFPLLMLWTGAPGDRQKVDVNRRGVDADRHNKSLIHITFEGVMVRRRFTHQQA